jgi:transketolase
VYLRLSRAEVGRLALPGTEKGDSPHLCEAPFGPFRQMGTVPFFRPSPFVLGKALIRREGSDVALVATGQMLEATLEAARLLERAGASAHVVDMHTVKPIDAEALIEAADRCGRVVTCEEHTIIGGLGSMVCSVLAHVRPTPVRMIGIRDAFGQSGTYDELRQHYGLTAHIIAQTATELVAGTRR